MSDYTKVFKNADVTGEVCVADTLLVDCTSKACCGGATCEGKCVSEIGKVAFSAREIFLKEVTGIVTKDRNNIYGPPEDSFKVIAAYWDTYLKHSNVATVDAADVAIMMALMKMARLTSNKQHRDSAVDAAGYLACLQEALQ